MSRITGDDAYKRSRSQPHQIKDRVGNELKSVLDSQLHSINSGDLQLIRDNIQGNFSALDKARKQLSVPEENDDRYWREVIEKLCKPHPFTQRCIEDDPFTRAAHHGTVTGNPGNSGILEYIYAPHKYRHEVASDNLFAQELFEGTTNLEASRAVRARRHYMAKLIDQYLIRGGLTVKNPRILSVAAGRSREIELSHAFARQGETPNLVALDKDNESLGIGKRYYPNINIDTAPMNIKKLAQGENSLGEFDLVYSLGLYDYFEKHRPITKNLTCGLFNSLKPGGKLILANFCDSSSRGYMEATMNWNLIYRNEADMQKLYDFVKEEYPDQVKDNPKITLSSDGNIYYIEIEKVGESELVNSKYHEEMVFNKEDSHERSINAERAITIPSTFFKNPDLFRLALRPSKIDKNVHELIIGQNSALVEDIAELNGHELKQLNIEDIKLLYRDSNLKTLKNTDDDTMPGSLLPNSGKVLIEVDDDGKVLEEFFIFVKCENGEYATLYIDQGHQIINGALDIVVTVNATQKTSDNKI